MSWCQLPCLWAVLGLRAMPYSAVWAWRGEFNPHQFIYTINQPGKGPACILDSLNVSVSGFQRQTVTLELWFFSHAM